MRATGIVRRIDDLGRVVIPKEVRRSMNIQENEPLEIYTDVHNGEIILKKYQDDRLTPMGEKMVNTLKAFGIDASAYDRDGERIAGKGREHINTVYLDEDTFILENREWGDILGYLVVKTWKDNKHNHEVVNIVAKLGSECLS